MVVLKIVVKMWFIRMFSLLKEGKTALLELEIYVFLCEF